MWKFIKKQPASRITVVGFVLLILLGSVLLIMPFSIKSDVQISYADALFTSASAVCTTGLVCVDLGNTFTDAGQVILALLMQIGGLGVTAFGAGLILMLGQKMNLKGRSLLHNEMVLDNGKKVAAFVRDIFLTTIVIELTGAVLCFFVFVKDYDVGRAIGISLFHSIAAFNNAGMDILGDFKNLQPYNENVLMNLSTAGMCYIGGVGFLVVREIVAKKFNWKKFSMHAKVVFVVSLSVIFVATLLLKFTEGIPWLEAFFHSVTGGTAGFTTRNLSEYSDAGLFVLIILMFIGASPGSTGCGIKTTTLFALLLGVWSMATNKSEKAFGYAVPKDAFKKAGVIATLSLILIVVSTYLMLIFERSNASVNLMGALFECTSAFGTVGMSTGITPTLTDGSKVLLSFVMLIGRLGTLTIVSMWFFSRGGDRVSHPDGNLAIG